MHALRAYCHHRLTLLHTVCSYALTLLQPGDIVCSALAVHDHKNKKQVELINSVMVILKACFFLSVLILCCRWLKEVG